MPASGMTGKPYSGRFAPSPTGPLHFGSLLAALASYLEARSRGGRWLLRMDDLDKPREAPGAIDNILHALDAYGLHWDGPVVYQSDHQDHYWAACERLLDYGHVYYCSCSRQDLLDTLPEAHPCRDQRTPPSSAWAIRVRAPEAMQHFTDRIQGAQQASLAGDDFVVFRKDGFAAYQLATAVDEHLMGITDVVRGSDLLDSAFRQRLLMGWLYGQVPEYAHIPVATHADGQKLSKQSHAPAIDPAQWQPTLRAALALLGQATPDDANDPAGLLQQAIANWSIQDVPARLALSADSFCKP